MQVPEKQRFDHVELGRLLRQSHVLYFLGRVR